MGDLSIPIELHGFTAGPDDPRAAQPPVEPWQPGEQRRYVIQFVHSLSRDERQAIQGRFGLLLEAYIPKFAYVERVTASTVDELRQHPLVNALFPLVVEHKESPGIGKTEFWTPGRQNTPGMLLHAVLFPEASPEAIRHELERLGATDTVVLDDRGRGGVARIELVVMAPELVKRIAALEAVRWVEEVPEALPDSGIPTDILQTGALDLTPITDSGLRGARQVVGIIETGSLNVGHCWFRDPVFTTPGPLHRKVIASHDDAGGGDSVHAAFVAGILAGDDVANPGTASLRGIACDAKISYGNRRDFKGEGSSRTLYNSLEQAARDNASIVNNSWHSQGNPSYSQDAADVDRFMWDFEECLVVGSSGNSGEELGPPGSAKNALCVAAAYVDPATGVSCLGDGFPGPVEGGRRKPDLLAPGCNIESADTTSRCGVMSDAAMGGPSPGTPPCGPATAHCASSFATPVASAAAVIVRQYFAEGWYPTGRQATGMRLRPSGALLKAALLNATAKTTHAATYPSDSEGWGLLQLDRILRLPGRPRRLRVWDVRNSQGLFTGERATHEVTIRSGDRPLKVTLAWTEPPGQLNATTPVVNDLDLVVTAPNGTQSYLGNCFQNGVSDPGGVPETRVADPCNNVEMVLVDEPAAGTWQIAVLATEVNVGATGQGYALVVRGNLD